MKPGDIAVTFLCSNARCLRLNKRVRVVTLFANNPGVRCSKCGQTYFVKVKIKSERIGISGKRA